MANMLSKKEPWDLVAPGYANITMKLFRPYALAAIEFVQPNKRHQIVDIACGPGTLALEVAPQVASVKALDFSLPMIHLLESALAEKNLQNIEARLGDGQQLPYDNDSFDAAFSLFGLMFFPDRAKAYTEIWRTLKPGGKTVISSWAPVKDSSAFQLIFGALRAINPAIPEPQTDIESLENPEFFKAELEQAGFRQVAVHRVTGEFVYTNAEQFWNDMVRANAPISMYKKSLPENEWDQKNQIAIEFLKQQIPNPPVNLVAHAWLAVGEKYC